MEYDVLSKRVILPLLLTKEVISAEEDIVKVKRGWFEREAKKLLVRKLEEIQ